MLVFYIILGVIVVGAAVALAMLHKMHWTAFVGAAAVALLLPLPVNAITLAVAKDQQQTFHEYWNGYETRAYQTDVACTRDGVCRHTYDCDPYTVTETEFYTDSEGKSKTRQVTKTKYHSCPYSTQETTYYVDTTLKTFTIDSAVMTGEPYRIGRPIPGGQVTEPPALWSAAKKRIEAGNPSGVTLVNAYKNYILGSENTLFKRYSDLIDELKAKDLLPDPTSGVTDHYMADKLHFVGKLDKLDKHALREDLRYLNGAVGTELRGDLHVVMVDNTKLTVSPENYGNALLAHWQNTKEFGRDALAKNAIVLVVAVEPYKPSRSSQPAIEDNSAELQVTPAAGTPVVKWAHASTGMPVGNEHLLQQFASELPGTPIDDNFLGSPGFDVKTEKILHTDGVVENMLWGVNKFERVSMDAKDADDNGTGFGYLSDEWQPDTGTLTIIYVISSILFALALSGGIYASITLRGNRSADFVRYLFTKH